MKIRQFCGVCLPTFRNIHKVSTIMIQDCHNLLQCWVSHIPQWPKPPPTTQNHWIMNILYNIEYIEYSLLPSIEYLVNMTIAPPIEYIHWRPPVYKQIWIDIDRHCYDTIVIFFNMNNKLQIYSPTMQTFTWSFHLDLCLQSVPLQSGATSCERCPQPQVSHRVRTSCWWSEHTKGGSVQTDQPIE